MSRGGDSRTFALWLHVLGAGIWLGAHLTQATIGNRMMSNERSALPWLKAVEARTRVIYGSAMLLILLPGIYLVLSSDGVYSFGSAFIGIGFAILIIGGALGGLVLDRKTRQMISLYEEGEAAQAEPIHRSLGMWAVLDAVLIAFAILAMVAKWGA